VPSTIATQKESGLQDRSCQNGTPVVQDHEKSRRLPAFLLARLGIVPDWAMYHALNARLGHFTLHLQSNVGNDVGMQGDLNGELSDRLDRTIRQADL